MRSFAQVDVFGARPGTGNPLAVVQDADGLTSEQMAAFARWTMLSETTFLLPPSAAEADYRVRIFTTGDELPFAGHPTLGSAHAWLAAGGVPQRPGRVIQECGAGLVEVRVDAAVDAEQASRLSFLAPPLRRSGPLDTATLARVLSCLRVSPDAVVAHSWGVNGPPWAMVQLRDAAAVRGLVPDVSGLTDDLLVGVVGLCVDGEDHAYEVRAFCPPPPSEDPVTGSLNAAIASWMRTRGLVGASYLVRQGKQAGFDGLLTITHGTEGLWVGGTVRTIVTGGVRLPW